MDKEFELDLVVRADVPDSMLLANGTYRANITKAEVKRSQKGGLMVALTLLVPADEKNKFATTIFDTVMLNHENQFCQIKEKQFLMATKITNTKEVGELVGKSVEIRTAIKNEEGYGEKVTVSRYVKDSLKDTPAGEEVPF